VILHSALCILSAGARARISALFSDASLLAGALGIDNALGTAVGSRAGVSRQAGARRAVSIRSALAVWSARIGHTRISLDLNLRRGRRWCLPEASRERISGVSRWARANRVVIDDLAPGIESTASSTRLFAFVVAAGLGRGALRVDDALGSAVGW
jgi:hypothetical protein